MLVFPTTDTISRNSYFKLEKKDLNWEKGEGYEKRFRNIPAI